MFDNKGFFNRRQILQGGLAAGLTGAMLQAGITPAMAAPKRGGTFRIAISAGSTTDSADPATWNSGFVILLGMARSGFLTELLEDGSLAGEIAESWEAAPDAKTWTFKIRQGVTYHSGKPVTPEDVVASVNYHRGDKSKSLAKSLLKPVTDIKVDGQKVVFMLASGNADFPFIVSDYHLPILPSSNGEIDPQILDGCGPYVIKSWERGVSAKLERSKNYWKSGRAWFDQVEIITVADSVARQNALISGQVDMIDPVDVNTIAQMRRVPGIKVLTIDGASHFTLPMDFRKKPFDDNNVRMALKYAVDREELVQKILGGFGSVGNDHPIAKFNRYYNPNLPQRAYDPDKAKFYLKQAGLSSLSVQMNIADAAFRGVGAVDTALLYSEKAAAAGIKIDVVREPNDGYWENVWMKRAWCGSYWSSRPTEDWTFTSVYSSGASSNESYWENARFNELLLAARGELDENKRRQMYYEMQEICSNEGSTVTPMFANYIMGMSSKLGHADVVGKNWGLDNWRVIERWWFA